MALHFALASAAAVMNCGLRDTTASYSCTFVGKTHTTTRMASKIQGIGESVVFLVHAIVTMGIAH